MKKTSTLNIGVTLMEVLISIGVVAIGLLGVASLIPVGGQQAQAGARNDRIASVGRRTFREFRLRGLNHVGVPASGPSWVVWAPGVGQFVSPNQDGDLDGTIDALHFPFNILDYNADFVFNVDDLIDHPRSICIDPMGMRLAEQAGTIGSASVFGVDWVNMPSGTAKGIRALMPSVVPSNFVLSFAPGVLGPACEETFLAQDDLIFDEPENNSDAPAQSVLNTANSAGVTVPGKRYAEGRYSWFATLVPLDPIDEDPTNGDPAEEKESGALYRLSTAVVAERNAFQVPEVIPVAVGTNGLPNITLIDGGARVVLDATQPPTPGFDNGLSPNIKTGNWIMLATRPRFDPYSATPQVISDVDPQVGEGNFGWYRVRRVTDNVLTLSGLTLPGPPPNAPAPIGVPVPDGQDPWVYAVVVPNVENVYTRTIRLEP